MTVRILFKTITILGLATALSGQSAAERPNIPIVGQIFGVAVNGVEGGFTGEVVTGKPFSATEERHSLQVLGDGTRIETKQTTRIARDSQGRTRMEDVVAPGQPRSAGFEFGSITITDPVAGTRIALNPDNRTMLTAPGGYQALRIVRSQAIPAIVDPKEGNTRTENLAARNVNGVMARGSRTTTTIPAGGIGNNREIRIVTERWYSDDLQMLVKSTNNDPRFGETEYQLTGITTNEPNPSFFQAPAGYTEAAGGRGVRGGNVGPEPGAAPGGRGRGGRGGAKQQ
jgi:hypothetical protein